MSIEQRPKSTETPVPHAGGQTNSPENAALLTKPEKKRRSALIAGVGIGAAGLLAGGIALGLNSHNNQTNTPPEKSPETSEPAKPTPEASFPTPEEFSKEIALEVAELPKPADVIETYFTESVNTYLNANTGQPAQDAWRENDRDYERTTEIVNKPIDSAFRDTIYVDGWQNNQNLVKLADYDSNEHSVVTALNILTYDTQTPELDIEPFEAHYEVDSYDILESSKDSFTAEVTLIFNTNGDMNRAPELIDESYLNETPFTDKYTFVKEDGFWKIADFEDYE